VGSHELSPALQQHLKEALGCLLQAGFLWTREDDAAAAHRGSRE